MPLIVGNMKQAEPKKIIGSFEQVSFPEFQIGKVTAKIDTGAYTGALHCTRIGIKKTPEGKVLHFSPFDQPEVTITTDKYALRHVRSSNGVNSKRYFIQTSIIVRGQEYPITLSLADRSDMKWPVLIGRRFLRRYHFLVDVGRTRKVS